MKKLNVAVVGCGNSSSIYLENLTGRFHNVQVYMQGSDYGTLYLQNGSGTIWFYSDRVIIDLSLPSHGVHELMQMLGYQ